jgi:hypothetical protein
MPSIQKGERPSRAIFFKILLDLGYRLSIVVGMNYEQGRLERIVSKWIALRKTSRRSKHFLFWLDERHQVSFIIDVIKAEMDENQLNEKYGYIARSTLTKMRKNLVVAGFDVPRRWGVIGDKVLASAERRTDIVAGFGKPKGSLSSFTDAVKTAVEERAGLMTQRDIANEVGIACSQVSRYLKQLREGVLEPVTNLDPKTLPHRS